MFGRIDANRKGCRKLPDGLGFSESSLILSVKPVYWAFILNPESGQPAVSTGHAPADPADGAEHDPIFT